MVDFDYDQFVVVAEKEWKLEFGWPVAQSRGDRSMKFPVTIGDIDWQMYARDNGQVGTKHFSLFCTSVSEHCADQVHAEFHGYSRVGNAPNYVPAIKRRDANSSSYVTTPLRHVFKQNDNSIDFTVTLGSEPYENTSLLFIVRILKERAALPDFKSEAVNIGNLVSNRKLHVGDQTFHVNKELLSAHSKVFDRMFNGGFLEANQEEVELKHELSSPALFEDFLLVLCVQDALPNRKNLIDLFKLANIYDAENVRGKCERHFRMCREMPVEERFMLALELGNEEMQDSIMKAVDLAETKRVVAVLVLEKQRAEALAAQQRKLLDEALADNRLIAGRNY